MKGQWLGRNEGDHSLIIVNIDELQDCYDGYAFINPDNGTLPSSLTFIRTIGKPSQGELLLTFLVLNRDTGNAESWEKVRHQYSGEVTFQDTVVAKFIISEAIMTVSWTNLNNEVVSVKLVKTDYNAESVLDHTIMSWDDFKVNIKSYMGREFLFRGQNCLCKLRTSLHRAERYNFLRYINEQVKELHWHVSPTLKHLIDLYSHEGLVSLLGIAQHHGYPTPLLDWTYSPYVAAYFAFASTSKHLSNEYVRIYFFNQGLWHDNMSRIERVLDPRLFVTVVKPLAIGNDRIMPQQGTTTLSNVDDIEGYIMHNERISGNKYLHAVDILASERSHVISDLRYMGITASSLFPGLDGTCQELRDRHFNL